MFNNLSSDWKSFSEWGWDQISSFADDLLKRELGPESVEAWLGDWSHLGCLIFETFKRLYIRTTTHTNDENGLRAYREYSQHVMPPARAFEQGMRLKLLESGLAPPAFEIPLQQMRSDAKIYREENLALRSECESLQAELSALAGARVIEWEEGNLNEAEAIDKLGQPDRTTRERAWRALGACLGNQRQAIDDLWIQLLNLRTKMAHNAGFEDYRSYRWRELHRFSYTPDQCKQFHSAIQDLVVPAVQRLANQRKRGLSIDTLRVWDDHWIMQPDPMGRPALEPFKTVDELTSKVERVFSNVDPVFASYYHTMRTENLLDLDARSNKAHSGYMEEFPASKRAFIFTTAVGSSLDVLTQLHEGGHAFHAFEAAHWPHFYQSMLEYIPIEFVEVPSMGMELLASPYLGTDMGGFYTPQELAQARSQQLQGILEWLPYMAVVDAFQHWVYENPKAALDTDQCDEAWARLHKNYLPQFDWTGIEDSLRLCWRLQGHILHDPFYYVEYGMAQLGAIQLWANALEDQDQSVAAYRRALSLGNTASLPELYRTAGIAFDFGRKAVARAVHLIEETLDSLD